MDHCTSLDHLMVLINLAAEYAATEQTHVSVMSADGHLIAADQHRVSILDPNGLLHELPNEYSADHCTCGDA